MKIGKEVFIANTATVVGDVVLGDNSSVWFGSVVRGDSDKIEIGKNSNVQDTAVVHVDPNTPTKIGDNVTVGHGAIIHGATVGNNSLIGMRATLLNNAVIGENCIIGAHALVTEGKIIPDNSLVLGSPGKVVKTYTDEEVAANNRNSGAYVIKGKEYLAGKYKPYQNDF